MGRKRIYSSDAERVAAWRGSKRIVDTSDLEEPIDQAQWNNGCALFLVRLDKRLKVVEERSERLEKEQKQKGELENG